MVEDRTGCSWSKKEDKKLKRLFFEHCSFQEMAQQLGRTWFACKCRLIRLGLMEGSLKNPKYGETPFEPYRVPWPPKFDDLVDCIRDMINEPYITKKDNSEEDTSRTFSDAELNIVIDYLKTQIARISVLKLESSCFMRGIELSTAEDLFTNEIKKAQSLKRMSVEEREKVCKRLC